MPWPAPLEVPGVAYHIVHSGNGQPITFSCYADYRVYRTLITTYCSGYALDVWAYCLLPDRVHLVAVPGRIESVRKAFAEAHRYYNRHINLVKNWRGKLWQGRLALYPVAEDHLIPAARYVEMLPVHAGLSERALDYPWSSARAHCQGADDELVRVKPLLDMAGDWRKLLQVRLRKPDVDRLRLHEKTGRPLGSEAFVHEIERALSRIIGQQKPGRKRKGDQRKPTPLPLRIRA